MADKVKHVFSQAALSFILVVFLMTASAQAQQVTLAWDQPVTNEDGSALTDIAGYIVYYGTNPGVYIEGYDVGAELTYTFNNLVIGQTYYFSVTAYDSNGNESQYSTEVSETVPPANVLPEISSFDATPSSGHAPLPVTFSVSAADPDGTITSYEWDVDGDGTYDTTTDTAALSYNYINAGTYAVTVKITDDSGEFVISEPVTISVTINVAPVVTSVSKKRKSSRYYAFSTNASDPDGQVMTYKWDFNGDGRIDKTTTSKSASFRFRNKGTYRVKVKAIDNEGKAASRTYKASIY